MVVAREVTKIHEEFLRGRAGEVLETLKSRAAVKGEITLLIGKAEEEARAASDATVRVSVRQRVEQIMAEEKVDEKTALKTRREGARSLEERGLSRIAAGEIVDGDLYELCGDGRPGRPTERSSACYFPASSFFTISLTICRRRACPRR